MRTISSDLVLVTKHELRMLWREFALSVRETLEGKLVVVAMLGGPFLVRSMLASSALRQARLDDSTAWFVLWIAHLSMAAAVVLGVSSRTARSLVVDRREDPLAQYPHARRSLAAFHVWGAVVSPTVLWLCAFFYMFHGAMVIRLAAQPAIGTVLHVVGHTTVSLALGVLAYRLVTRALERHPTWGRALFWMTGALALLAFLSMLGTSRFESGFAPHRMGELRWIFDGAARFFSPVTTLLGAPLRPGPLLGWTVGVGAATAIALGTSAPLMRSPSTLLLGEVPGPVNRRFESVFGRGKRRPAARAIHGVRLFLLKDVLLGIARAPQRFFRRQAAFLGTAGLAPVLAGGLFRENLLGGVEAEALLLGHVILLVCWSAYLRGLGSLGSEGPVLALIRPAVRPLDLLGYKALSVMAAVLPAGLAYGATAGAFSQFLVMRPGPIVAVGVAGLTAVVAATFAVSLSFLFPDFQRRNVLVPGSSRLGRMVYVSGALCGAGVVAGLRWMTRTGTLPREVFVPGLITTAGVGLVTTGIVTLLALHRFSNLEH